MFRGYVITNAAEALATRRPPRRAAVLAAVLSMLVFALLHAGDLAAPGTAPVHLLAMGGLFAAAYVLTGQFRPVASGVHFGWNVGAHHLFGLFGPLAEDSALVVRLELDGPAWLVGASGAGQLLGAVAGFLALGPWLRLRPGPPGSTTVSPTRIPTGGTIMPTADTDTTHREPQAAADTEQRPLATRRFATAGLVAAGAVFVAVVWGGVAIIGLADQVGDLSRTAIPGEATINIDEPTERVVYDERQTWDATLPMDAGLDVEVTGPDGQAVAVAGYDLPVQYRLPGLVGEAVAIFDADQPGDYPATVDTPADAETLPGDARAAVGPSLAPAALGGLLGPVIVLVVGLLATAIIAIRAATYRT